MAELDSIDDVQYQSREYLEENENDGQREETRADFSRRSHEALREVRQRGQIAYGYNPVTDVTWRAGRVKAEIEKYGIKVVYHDGVQK